jgi:integrase
MEHYLAARVGQKIAPKPKPDFNTRSLDFAIHDYLENLAGLVEQGRRSSKTLIQRTSLFKKAADFKSPEGIRIGDFDRALTPEAIEFIRDQWGARTAQADNCVKAFVSLYKWLKISPNPARGIEKVHESRGGAKAWSTTDLKNFMKTHPVGSTARLWLLLALFTGARRDDLAILGREHEEEREGLVWIEWQPQKKGSAFVSIPMMPQLYAATREMKVQGKSYLLNEHGRPFKNGNSLGTKVQRWTKAAGLERRSSHGLRKALATLLAEVGCSTHQIMSVLAHTKASTSEIYTESAERSRMARAAFDSIKHVQI